MLRKLLIHFAILVSLLISTVVVKAEDGLTEGVPSKSEELDELSGLIVVPEGNLYGPKFLKTMSSKERNRIEKIVNAHFFDSLKRVYAVIGRNRFGRSFIIDHKR